MFDAIKPLVDSGIINEDTKQAISEAWESKLNEARDQIRAEIREEFAGRYEHDKGVMVDALDKMVTESLQAEIREFADEKAQLAADRVRFNKRMSESAGKFDQFLVSKLAEEIKEFVIKNVATYQIPRQVWIVDELPKTNIGKIDRTQLTKKAQDLLNNV